MPQFSTLKPETTIALIVSAPVWPSLIQMPADYLFGVRDTGIVFWAALSIAIGVILLQDYLHKWYVAFAYAVLAFPLSIAFYVMASIAVYGWS